MYKEYTDNVVKASHSRLQKEVVETVVPLIAPALTKALQDGNINAVPHALKIVGLDNVDTQSNQAQSLTVVLPGAAAPAERAVNEKTED